MMGCACVPGPLYSVTFCSMRLWNFQGPGTRQHCCQRESVRWKAPRVSSRRTIKLTCSPRNGIGSSWPGLLPQTLSKQSIRSQYNAASLAFLGDSVWESFLRQHYFGSGKQPLRKYHQDTKHHATAVQQAIHYESLVAQARVDASPDETAGADGDMGTAAAVAVAGEAGSTPQTLTLSEEELGVLRWARNGSTISPPRGMDALQYKKATAVEVLIAWLYLTDLERCHELMQSLVARPRDANPRRILDNP